MNESVLHGADPGNVHREEGELPHLALPRRRPQLRLLAGVCGNDGPIDSTRPIVASTHACMHRSSIRAPGAWRARTHTHPHACVPDLTVRTRDDDDGNTHTHTGEGHADPAGGRAVEPATGDHPGEPHGGGEGGREGACLPATTDSPHRLVDNANHPIHHTADSWRLSTPNFVVVFVYNTCMYACRCGTRAPPRAWWWSACCSTWPTPRGACVRTFGVGG